MDADILAIVAGVLTSLAMLPQLMKVIKEKNVKNLSIKMLLLLIGGLTLWIIYGIYEGDWAIIFFNALALVIDSILLLYLVKYKKN